MKDSALEREWERGFKGRGRGVGLPVREEERGKGVFGEWEEGKGVRGEGRGERAREKGLSGEGAISLRLFFLTFNPISTPFFFINRFFPVSSLFAICPVSHFRIFFSQLLPPLSSALFLSITCPHFLEKG